MVGHYGGARGAPGALVVVKSLPDQGVEIVDLAKVDAPAADEAMSLAASAVAGAPSVLVDTAPTPLPTRAMADAPQALAPMSVRIRVSRSSAEVLASTVLPVAQGLPFNRVQEITQKDFTLAPLRQSP